MAEHTDNLSAGTQVVSLVEVRGTNNSLVHPRGAVGDSKLPERPDYEAANCFLIKARRERATNNER